MKRLLRWVPLALVVLAFPGCYKLNVDARALEPHVYVTTEAAPGEAPERLGEFEAETKASWVLWGLVDLDEPEVEGALDDAIRAADGTAAVDVTVVTQQTFVDGLLTLLTLGIYSQRTTTISGTVVR